MIYNTSQVHVSNQQG